ncbi:hypothetical protein R5H30_02640 [Sulfitobacter sp. D35]|uniref:hypothetical protein n=1 Tax=Sulfitobacter sp. D35 TaxID=3083252 RepID=UPI00296ED2B7|nr:hypothetical protein [Sulfitobacter sp. D35]MDW4496864.1 hypothetical protein [Sulfitobacter sp. D35]
MQDSAPANVAEIVTFSLSEGQDETAFVLAARALETYLRDTGAMVARTLSRDAEGRWTDHILWTSREAAEAAARDMPRRPEAADFLAAIAGDSVEIRHAEVILQMD